MAISSHPVAQRLGQTVGHWGKRVGLGVLEAVLPQLPNVPLEAVGNVRRVLLVRPNFRIGNTLIATPLIVALRQRFPQAQVDYLGGDTTSVLLEHLPVDTVHVLSRRFVMRPWSFIALFVRLRRVQYDVAVEAGLGSFSGMLYTYLTGARHRIGCGSKGERFLNVRLPAITAPHAYEKRVAFARLLGVSCPSHPVYTVGPEEHRAAMAFLRGLNLVASSGVLPFVAVFVGGHLDKRWPAARWIELVRAAADLGGRMVVFLGPEEVRLEGDYRRELPAGVRVLRPQPLRLFAALLSMARLIVSPDSGPMHLAAALEVPVVTLLQQEGSRAYLPQEPQDRVLVRPRVDEAVATMVSHPAWPAIVAPVVS
jgi:heptosyltransferase-3